MPSHSTTRRLCVVYKHHTLHTYCYQCGFKFIYWKEGCFQKHHEVLARRWYNICILCLPLKFACFYFYFLFFPHFHLSSSFLSYSILKYMYAFEFLGKFFIIIGTGPRGGALGGPRGSGQGCGPEGHGRGTAWGPRPPPSWPSVGTPKPWVLCMHSTHGQWPLTLEVLHLEHKKPMESNHFPHVRVKLS
jgi:hypothetical protein